MVQPWPDRALLRSLTTMSCAGLRSFARTEKYRAAGPAPTQAILTLVPVPVVMAGFATEST
jgi:hypothetical protein